MKRAYWVALLGSVGCLVLLLCIGTTAFAGYFLYTNSSTVRSVNRIAVVDNDMNIQIVDAKGGQRVSLTTDAAGAANHAHLFPAWSPDSQHVAFVSLSGDANQHEGTLDVAPVSGGHLTTVFKSQTDLPFYAYWSPDNQQIAFLTQNDQDQALMVAVANGQIEAHKLSGGSPLYWSWSPDGKRILMHLGGSRSDSPDARMSFLAPQGNQSAQDLANAPGNFQSPQFSPDGSAILFASSDNSGNDSLFRADSQGKNPQAIQSYSGTIAFAWSPNGKKIATLATPADSDLPNEGPIFVSDADGKNQKQVVKENALAFYWSPDSQSMAYLTLAADSKTGCAGCQWLGSKMAQASSKLVPQLFSSRGARIMRAAHGLGAPLGQSQTINLTWHVVSLLDGQPHTLVTFQPTDTFLALVPFFDQYSRSLTFWSPDSKSFLYAQSENDTDGSVWVVDAIQGAMPRKIADGTFADWSWH